MAFWLFLIGLFALIAGLFFVLISILWSVFTEAPFVPTGRRDLKKIFELAQLKPGEIFYDLGSGDGRFVIAAARRGARAYGFEKVLPLAVLSKIKILFLGLRGKASVECANFLKINFQPVDVIFCYLLPKGMEKLKEKFEKELRPGTRVISRAFKISGWEPESVHRFGRFSPPVYVYIR